MPTIAANDDLSSHSIRDLERERLLAVLKRHDWHVFSASQDLGTKLRVLYSQMERLGIEPARQAKYRRREIEMNSFTSAREGKKRGLVSTGLISNSNVPEVHDPINERSQYESKEANHNMVPDFSLPFVMVLSENKPNHSA